MNGLLTGACWSGCSNASHIEGLTTLESNVKIADEVIFQEVDGEAVLLKPDSVSVTPAKKSPPRSVPESKCVVANDPSETLRAPPLIRPQKEIAVGGVFKLAMSPAKPKP
jgi:hypothetical protein